MVVGMVGKIACWQGGVMKKSKATLADVKAGSDDDSRYLVTASLSCPREWMTENKKTIFFLQVRAVVICKLFWDCIPDLHEWCLIRVFNVQISAHKSLHFQPNHFLFFCNNYNTLIQNTAFPCKLSLIVYQDNDTNRIILWYILIPIKNNQFKAWRGRDIKKVNRLNNTKTHDIHQHSWQQTTEGTLRTNFLFDE